MPELVPKLAANLAFVAIALLGWGLEHWWRDRRTHARRRVAYCLFGLIIAGSVADGFVTWHSHNETRAQQERIARIDQGVLELVMLARERDPNLTEQEALKKIGSEVRTLRGRTSKLETQLDGVKRYGNVAKLNGMGLSGKVRPGSGLRETTSLFRVLEGAYDRKERGGQATLQIRCDDKGIAAFRKAAEINPDFPFSYWALAICGARAGDKEWRKHAKRAVTIFEHTTQIAGHHPGHDGALTGLKELLARQ